MAKFPFYLRNGIEEKFIDGKYYVIFNLRWWQIIMVIITHYLRAIKRTVFIWLN